jgi:prepilin-type N-terminal cleavage/methylation domain-containing protein
MTIGVRRWALSLPSRSRGFTVLEVLTVLVIGAIVLALLQQGFALSLRASERANEVANNGARRLLGEAWFRQTLASTLSARVGEAGTFTGDESRLAGLSATALVPDGSPDLHFSMSLRPEQDRVGLFYRHGEREVRLFDVARGARFAYLDETRRRWSQWPPREQPLGADSAPAWVAVVDGRGAALIVVALPPRAPRTREVSPFNAGDRP